MMGKISHTLLVIFSLLLSNLIFAQKVVSITYKSRTTVDEFNKVIKVIEEFIGKVEKHFKDYKILKLKEVKIDNIFFPRLMPNLTELQKRGELQTIELQSSI
jgi:cell shape-determining protein MreC